MDQIAHAFCQWLRALAACALFVFWHSPALAQPSALKLSEYEIKAAFLLNFTKFIVWPNASAVPDAPFTICIAGENPFGQTLDRLVEGERVNGRPMVVRPWPSTPAAACAILFVGKSEREIAPLIRELPEGVLTVGESENFLHQGGMIALAVENRRVRFDVNSRATAKGGLSLSSRLLNVARSVDNQERP